MKIKNNVLIALFILISLSACNLNTDTTKNDIGSNIQAEISDSNFANTNYGRGNRGNFDRGANKKNNNQGGTKSMRDNGQNLVAPASGEGPLSAVEIDALVKAINDERKAKATYEATVEKFGDMLPLQILLMYIWALII